MMAPQNLVPLLFRRLALQCPRFATDGSGASAVEFAVLLPLMLVMYFGSIQITDAISADRQITLVASTIAEITSQSPSSPPLASTDVQNIIGNATASPPGGVAPAVLTPFSVSNAKITLTSVVIDGASVAHVDWSATLYGTARSGIVTSLIPQGLLIPCTSVIWGEATYNYKPTIGWVITGTLPMYDQIFLRPRNSACVQYNGSLCPSMLAGCVANAG